VTVVAPPIRTYLCVAPHGELELWTGYGEFAWFKMTSETTVEFCVWKPGKEGREIIEVWSET
jgi:hypothetical protein